MLQSTSSSFSIFHRKNAVLCLFNSRLSRMVYVFLMVSMYWINIVSQHGRQESISFHSCMQNHRPCMFTHGFTLTLSLSLSFSMRIIIIKTKKKICSVIFHSLFFFRPCNRMLGRYFLGVGYDVCVCVCAMKVIRLNSDIFHEKRLLSRENVSLSPTSVQNISLLAVSE